MEATRTGLLKFLQEPKQLILSDNETPYHWTEEECRKLWDDIVSAAGDDSITEHFMGAIMILEKGLFCTTEIPKLVLIDGQQRLVTVSLVLAALGKIVEKNSDNHSEMTHKKIYDRFFTNNILNKDEDSEALYYKLVLSSVDNRAFVRLIEGNEHLPLPSMHPIVKAYRFFENKIKESGISADVLYRGIDKLTVVDISTDRHYDNPQFVFDNLVATGLSQAQSKLISKWVSFLLCVSFIPVEAAASR
jgi:uncharacterized protein with ParB-like and HNH nuclease domain